MYALKTQSISHNFKVAAYSVTSPGMLLYASDIPI